MQKKWWLVIIAVLIVIAGVAYWLLVINEDSKEGGLPVPTNAIGDSSSVTAGKLLSGDKCEGTGPGILTKLPMDESDFSFIIPYGLVIGGHVTPIDHQYFSPTVFNSKRDAYPVYAMADSTITDISERTTDRGTEYRFVFTMSCTFLYYYDLVTSLSPEIKSVYDSGGDMNISVDAGQLVGRIGGQTLDFAVWDTSKPLTGFVKPASYEKEPWKIYTADPLNYYLVEIRKKVVAKYLRTTEPISGKIDHDIDGKLVGNWFLKDTNGYAGESGETGDQNYWTGHLSIAPEHIDPTASLFSIGSWDGGNPKQFLIELSATNPAKVGIETGLVKYNLRQLDYRTPSGDSWDRSSLVKGLRVKEGSNEQACVLLQLTDTRTLKLEGFPSKKCSEVSGFTTSFQTYER